MTTALLTTEGTYPFEGGGVSAWCDVLVRELPDVDFTVLAITGGSTSPLRWDPPPNVRVVRVPLWEAGDPTTLLEPGVSLRERIRATTDAVVEDDFVPVFRRVLRGMQGAGELDGAAVHQLARFARKRHWPTAWRSRSTWRAFVAEETVFALARDGQRPSVFDLSEALRSLYNLLLPLAAPLERHDVVHVSIASSAVLPGVVAAHEWGTPVIVTDHGIAMRERALAVSTADMTPYAKSFLLRLGEYLSRLAYAYASVIAPVAEFNRRWEEHYGADPSSIRTIYNGVDPSVFAPQPKPRERAGIPTVVAAARVIPVKDIETMIRAAAVTRRIVPDVAFVLYGSTDADQAYTDRCRALVTGLDLEGTFTFAGFHPSPSELYAEGDITILSSITEGFPYTVLESMSCGRPVAATDVGGVREALEGAGIVVPPRDEEALGAAVARLLQDEDLRLSLGRRGREQVLARFRTQRSVDAYRRLYDQAAA